MTTNQNQPIKVITHDGIFHSDEVLACVLISIAAQPKVVIINRSRSPKQWEYADFVVDVGGRCDNQKWFDHHQVNGAGVRDNGVPYSAFGLVWNIFGIRVIRNLLLEHIEAGLIKEIDIVEIAAEMSSFVCGIDAHDQALLSTVGKFTRNKKLILDVTTLQQIISGYNPTPLLEAFDEAETNKQFSAAFEFAKGFITRLIRRKASRMLSEAYVAKYDKGNNILVIPKYCDWNAPISKREHILFIIYPSVNGKTYTIQATKKGGGQNSTNNLRMAFPPEWSGLNEAELRKICNVEDAKFCHRDRFIAAASTLQGAITLANEAIKYYAKSK